MNSKKLSFILYEEKSPPRYFEINKTFVRFIFFGLPLISLLSLLTAVLLLVYLKEIKSYIEKKRPEIITELEQNNADLTEKNLSLTEMNDLLQHKLSTTHISTSIKQILSVFKPISGQKDLTNEHLFSVEDENITFDKKNILIKFKLVNITTPNRRLSGHIFVIMNNQNSIQFYPAESLKDGAMESSFIKGELFGTSRFRPVEATFSILKNPENIIFQVLIFSRTGDILHNQYIKKRSIE